MYCSKVLFLSLVAIGMLTGCVDEEKKPYSVRAISVEEIPVAHQRVQALTGASGPNQVYNQPKTVKVPATLAPLASMKQACPDRVLSKESTPFYGLEKSESDGARDYVVLLDSDGKYLSVFRDSPAGNMMLPLKAYAEVRRIEGEEALGENGRAYNATRVSLDVENYLPSSEKVVALQSALQQWRRNPCE